MLGTRQVVISEHMPDPYGQDLGQEWIELHNPTNSAVDVNGWVVRDCGDQAFVLSGPNLTIGPGDYLVLGMNSNFTTNGGVPVDLAYGTAFYLPNTLGSILLYDSAQPGATLIDQVRYSQYDPWDSFFAGKSLTRKDLLGDGTASTNWRAGTKSFGNGDNKGTPGGN